ncbi:MAG: ABC transporter ATP-binding protein [Rhodobacteraceae bacterium]|nr:ABC transporter ATP-binding protein [Paracoccaceae bacterium]
MLLRVTDLHKNYASGASQRQILRGVSLELAAGETLALTGESGSGKSTLLHLIAGLDVPDTGQIVLGGTDIVGLGDKARAALRRGTVGVVFQQFNLIPSLNVRANIAFQARLAGRYDRGAADVLAARIGLADHLDKYPEELSGGQQQRAAIARTLAAKPSLILADEPTGNLDEDTADRVLELMLDMAGSAGAALMVVTHSPRVAARMNRQLHLSRGQVVPRGPC